MDRDDRDQHYVEIAVGKTSHRGRAVKHDVVHSADFIRRHYERPMWRSYFVFGSELEAYLFEHGALLKDCGLDAQIDRIWLDYEIRGEKGYEGLSAALKGVREVVQHLRYALDVPRTAIQPWFSGRRGFHLELPNLFGLTGTTPEIPVILKASLENLIGHPMLDLSMLHPAGLIRLPWSKHEASGLHKIPLTLDELFTADVETITGWAADPVYARTGFTLAPLDDHRPIWADYVTRPKRGGSALSFGTRKEGLSVQHQPSHVVTCMQKLLARGPVKGRRHKDLLRLGSWLYGSGIPEDLAAPMLARWAMEAGTDDEHHTAERQHDHYAQHIRDVYTRGYLYSCKDQVKAEFCDPQCIFYDKKNHVPMIQDASSMARRYDRYVTRLHREGDYFDLAAMYGIGSYKVLPGEVMMVTGDTGKGKSAWVQNLEVDLPDFKIAHCNLEMNERLNFRRTLQIAHGLRKEQIDHLFLRGSEEEKERLLGPVEHILCRSAAPRLDDIHLILQQMAPDILVIDTTDAVEVPEAGTNETLALRMLMNRLTAWAEEYMTIIIGIHHIKKSASERLEGTYNKGGSMQIKQKLTLNDLTGHRAAVTKADHVFGLEGKRGERRRVLRCLKGRDNPPTDLAFDVDWPTFRFQRPGSEIDPLA